MAAVPPGPYSDYLAFDPQGGRLFATPQAAKAVAVIDIKNGRVVKMISGIGNSHGIYFSAPLKRLFVADGASGDVKVFSGDSYELIKTIPLAKGADWLTYDPATKCIYVNNGGDDAGMDHALVSAVDTEAMVKVADIPIASPALEASVIDPATGRLYVNLVDDGKIAVVDLARKTVTATWALTKGRRNMAITLEAPHKRLYVVTRDSPMHGSLIAVDTESGHETATLPIGGWADSISLDERRQRIYVSTGVGHLETFAIEPHDTYRPLPALDTAVMAKTGLYSREMDRMYVSVPHLGGTPAQIMVFAPTDYR
ncbi:MAG TPA: YncE family protein [Steroidobacteraceae bacterium]|nr:YncE family protein [Steroidobacteraceae bacterium]